MIALANFPRVSHISASLLEFLGRRLCIDDLDYAALPESIVDGWVAEVYRFQLRDDPRLPPSFRGPLVVRAYRGECALPGLRHEMETQAFLSEHSYPVPRPLLLEESGEILGGPFMLMEWVAGPTLVDLLLHHWTSILWAPARMAEVHARLHQLPSRGFPGQSTCFLGRSLERLGAAIRRHDLTGLVSGLRWLEEHQPEPAVEASILHLDFHPGNMIFDEGECKAVLDWSDADIGDRHADIAAALLLMKVAPVDVESVWDRLATKVGKGILIHNYLRAYRRILPIDEERVQYFLAWAALRRLVLWGTWLHAGPEACGIKPSCVQHIQPARIQQFCASFAQTAGVEVELV